MYAGLHGYNLGLWVQSMLWNSISAFYQKAFLIGWQKNLISLMARRKKKVDCGEHIDRISELPSNVIDVVLQQLSIEELIKTSVLSRKWRYMWASVSTLKFPGNFFTKYKHLDYHETSRIIMEVLSLHTGPLHEFKLRIPCEYPVKIEGCLNKWILFLSRKGVEKLLLAMPPTNPYHAPSHIFSCQELTSLQLEGFKLSSAPNFCGFKRLLTLNLFDDIFESGALESLMSGCSLLKDLTISYCSGFEHITVCSPFLKFLCIEGDVVIKSICLKQTQNLNSLIRCAGEHGDNIERGWESDLMIDLPKIEDLILSGGCIKAFSAISPQVLLETLNTLKYLKLIDVNFNEELPVIISVLESCPNLEELVIESDNKAVEPEAILKELDCKDCYFSQLQFVDITVKTAYKHALNLTRFVLAKSSSLDILTFKVGLRLSQSNSPTLLSISSYLLQMKRASPTAKVKFLYDR